jgi:Tfp pilus assembly protein PilO
VSTFSAKVLSLSDAHRKEQKIPSTYQMKQVNACWLRRIKDLKEMINEIDVLKNKK